MRGEARMENAPKLADFGDKAWPRDPVLAVQKDMSFPQLLAALIELAWRLVDQVAVLAQGKTACMKLVPMLVPCLATPCMSTPQRPA